MTDKCIECGRFIPNDQIFCQECIEKQKENRKLQKLLKTSKPVG